MSRKRHDNYNLNLEVEAALPVACGRPLTVGHYSYMNKFSVQVRICRPGIRVDAIRSYFETWFVPDGEDLVFRSPITAGLSVSDHLKWFHGLLQFHRKFIRKLEADGIQTVVDITLRGRSLSVEPEALLLAHQLHLKTEIKFGA